MVCLGNICRSPLAEGIVRQLAVENGLNWDIASAGTGNWHVGKQPDERSIAVAKKNGLDISLQKGRQFAASDFDTYDYIYVMDSSNYADVISIAKKYDGYYHTNISRLVNSAVEESKVFLLQMANEGRVIPENNSERLKNGNAKRLYTVSGGNEKTIIINLNKPIIENFIINAKDVKDGLNDFKHKVEEVLLEILNSANVIQ